MGDWRNVVVRAGRGVAALAILAVTVAAGPAYGADPQLPVFGMLGLARGQDAVLSLVLVHPQGVEHPGCRVTASFVDARGRVLRDAEGVPVQQTFALRDHFAAALTLHSAEVLGERPRLPIRAVLADAPEDGTPSDCGCLVGTLELVALNGRTDLAIYAQRPPGGGNPPPPPGCVF
jgi:hypothetical protein